MPRASGAISVVHVCSVECRKQQPHVDDDLLAPGERPVSPPYTSEVGRDGGGQPAVTA